MKPFDYYSRSAIAYPRKSDFVKCYVYRQGECLWSGYPIVVGESKSSLLRKFPGSVIAEEFDIEAHRAAVKEHTDCNKKREEEFKQDIFEKFGISDNPKRELLYSKAYDLGHAGGFSEIYNYFGDLVELIR